MPKDQTNHTIKARVCSQHALLLRHSADVFHEEVLINRPCQLHLGMFQSREQYNPGAGIMGCTSKKRRSRTDLAMTLRRWKPRLHRTLFPLILLLPVLSSALGCEYGGLLRPSVLKQLNPDVVRLLNELPDVDRPNEDIVGRLFAHGGLSHAKDGADGLMHDSIRIPEGQLIWQPAIIVMPHPGELELELFNDDGMSLHAAIMPSNGDKQYVLLPIHTKGRAKIRLDGPGYYWFGCPVANHVGRGMLGLILVRGDVPSSAKLDRPQQQRP